MHTSGDGSVYPSGILRDLTDGWLLDVPLCSFGHDVLLPAPAAGANQFLTRRAGECWKLINERKAIAASSAKAKSNSGTVRGGWCAPRSLQNKRATEIPRLAASCCATDDNVVAEGAVHATPRRSAHSPP